MKAMLVIQTGNGFAVAPYSGPVPDNFVESMQIATDIKSYSYGAETVAGILMEHFQPKPAEVAPATDTVAA